MRGPLRPRAGADGRRRDRRRRHPPDERLPARARRPPRSAGTARRRGAPAARGGRPDGHGRCGLSDLPQVGRRSPRARATSRDRQRRRGRARDDQGPLRDGAAPAPPARGADRGDAVLRSGRGVHLSPRGVRDLPREPPRRDCRARARRPRRRRRGLVRLRRGVGDARVDGGTPRHASPASSVPGAEGLPRPADADQQRRDARPRRPDPPRRVEPRPPLVGLRNGQGAGVLRGAARREHPGSWSTTTPAASTERSARSSPVAPRAESFRRPRSTSR